MKVFFFLGLINDVTVRGERSQELDFLSIFSFRSDELVQGQNLS